MTAETTTGTVDWDRIARRFSDALREIYDEPGRYVDPYAEALRRALGYVPAGEPGISSRVLPYDQLDSGFGLMTKAEAHHLLEGRTVIDRMNRERVEEQVKEMRAEVARVYREARKDVADYLRARCNERTVPSRYRREGVAWAADMIDPSVPKDQYGRLLSDGGEQR